MNKRLLPLLSRYIIVECFLFFLASLLAFTAVLLTVRMLRFTSLIVNKGVFFSQIAEVFLSIIPSFLEVSVPMAALLGVLLAFARFSSDSEIVVIRSSGISLYQLLLPVTAFALIVFSVSLLVSNFLRPWGNANLNRVLFEIARSKSTAGLDSGIFNKLGNVSIYAEQIDHYKGKLEKVLFDDRRDLNARRIFWQKMGKSVQILFNAQFRSISQTERSMS